MLPTLSLQSSSKETSTGTQQGKSTGQGSTTNSKEQGGATGGTGGAGGSSNLLPNVTLPSIPSIPPIPGL